MPPDIHSWEGISREQLYELVWKQPMTRLAKEFGISDVALKKRCRKLAIPTPSPGYWVKVEHGQKPERVPLPATIGAALPQVPASANHSQWPRETLGLCERAQGFLTALKASELSYKKLHRLESKLYPRAELSAATCEAAARLFHALLFAIESTGIADRERHRVELGPKIALARSQRSAQRVSHPF